jgi:hypothetical protein
MSIFQVPETSLQYYLLSFDALGNECLEPDGTKMSQSLVQVLASEAITDVFIFSHGWLGDVPAAHKQYRLWIQAMAKNTADIQKFKQIRPGFKPLLIGLHWPSLPWGNEDLTHGATTEATEDDRILSQEDFVERYTDRIADTPDARQALKTIFSEAKANDEPDELSPKAVEAYTVLNRESGLGSSGVAGSPDEDREPFDPKKIYQNSTKEGSSRSHFSLSRILSPLRTLSYWRMKARARHIGETGGFQLLTQLQQATSADVRFHLVGHSFGCIVMSATVAGPKAQGQLVRPVNSLSLIQGALSLWSYCADIPVAPGRAGYFNSIIAERRVAGPIITTRSRHDTAVGRMYPLASGISGDVDFDPTKKPRYGAIGTYGIRGGGIEVEPLEMLPCDQSYGFEAGKIYNLESSVYIRKIPPDAGLGGAHNSIDEPEVAHAVWEAALGQ